MPRWSHTERDAAGNLVMHMCGHTRFRKCSTPGCTRHADRECDYPVQRKVRKPKVGDTRLHKERKVVFYVRSVLPGGQLEISSKVLGKVQVVSLEDWNEKADATCDRPVCSRCVTRSGQQEWCAAHARAAAKGARR